MKNIILILCLVSFQSLSLAQSPQVPKVIRFADMKLELTNGAQTEIQTLVDALYRSPKYFKIKLDRINLYFPIIEQVLKEKNLPEDFKYLVIQESSLISDAVSSSNAVGFWQFKKPTAIEVGLQVDRSVDDRMHVVASTRGAATYLKRHNVYFDNWLYALLAYYAGRGGAQNLVNEKYFGKKKMEINKRTHWYVMKFLAHKVAFEHVIGKDTAPELVLREYYHGANKTLKEIADEVDLDRDMVIKYNKWLKRGEVPRGKVVILPVPGSESKGLLAQNREHQTEVPLSKQNDSSIPVYKNYSSDKYPIIEGDYKPNSSISFLVTVNGKPGIIAGKNSNFIGMAEKGDISIRRFLRYNDLESDDRAIPGQVYYLKRKRGKAKEHYHVVQLGETLWEISQKYGVRLKKLVRRNRMEDPKPVKPGRVLWMRFIRPRDEPIKYKNIEPKDVSKETVALVTDQKREEQNEKYQKSEETILSTANRVAQEEKKVNEATDKPIPEVVIDSIKKEKPKLIEASYTKEKELGAAGNISENNEGNRGGFYVQEPITFVDLSENNRKEDKTMHVVAKGETLYGISRSYSVALEDLLLWNGLQTSDGLKIGQKLYIVNPKPQTQEGWKVASEKPVSKEDGFIYHEVKIGETMYKIAREYNVTIKEVMEWNGKKDFSVSVGEQLKIMKVAP